MTTEPAFAPETNISEFMEYVMTITEQSDADTFWSKLIKWTTDNWNVPGVKPTRENAERITRKNIGYWSGYYKPEVGKRMTRLFGAYHPSYNADIAPSDTNEGDANER